MWLPQTKGTNTIGQFEGKVPLPEPKEGLYTLAVKLAPEEEAKKALADQTVIEFVMRKAPWPLWIRVVIWALSSVLLVVLISWQVRRRYVARLRLPFYYWVEDQDAWRVLVFERANDAKNLPEVSLRITRSGKEKKVRVEPAAGAKLLTGDGREVPSWETQEGGRILVQTAGGPIKAVSVNFYNPPPRPEP